MRDSQAALPVDSLDSQRFTLLRSFMDPAYDAKDIAVRSRLVTGNAIEGRIARIAATGESESVEFKSTTGTRREAAKTVCAMLNQQGGQVLFGVTPEGRVVGQHVSERTIEEVSAEFARIDPPAFPEITRIPVDGDRAVIAVSVSRGTAGPYMYRGSAYRRIGSTTVERRADEYRRLLFERMHSERRWENQPADGWSIDDLDANEIWTTVDEAVRRGRLEDPGTRDVRDLLRGLGLFRDGVLWRAAIALFGGDERIKVDMPQCLLRVARFRGIVRTEFLDNRQFQGNVFSLLKAAERFPRDRLPIAGRIEEDRMERIDEPLVPPLATREALANALCHRDYSIGGASVGVAVYDDRVEVTSTGTLHFGLTPEMLFQPHESIPWNPLIADVFYRRGIIERWGRGTLKMAEVTTAAGLPQPEIEDAGGCVTVRFRHSAASVHLVVGEHIAVTDKIIPKVWNLSELQRNVLDLLDQTDLPLALREIHARLPESASIRQVKRSLARLKDLGLVESTGRGVSARWKLVQGP